MDTKLESVNKYLDELKSQLVLSNNKITELEKAAVETDIRLSELERENIDILDECKYLRQKVDQLENQSRKFNIRILGVPDGAEAGNPTAFTTKLLLDLFGEEAVGPAPLISIAHRTGPARNGSRCMIARPHSFDTKRNIIGRAAGSRSLVYNGKEISIYPDLSAETVKQRASFNQVRAELRRLNLRSGFIHPSTLIFTYRDEAHKFPSAKDAQVFIDNHINGGDGDCDPSTQAV